MTARYLGPMAFTFFILFISGCSSKESRVVDLLKKKMESANGAVPEFQEVPVEDDKGNRLLIWSRAIVFWNSDDLSVEVKKTDSITHPYSGIAELSYFVLATEHVEKKDDVSQFLAACKVHSNTKKITLQQLDGVGTDFIRRNDLPPAERRKLADGQLRIKFHYRYDGSKWQLMNIEQFDPEGKSWKPCNDFEIQQGYRLSQFQ